MTNSTEINSTDLVKKIEAVRYNPSAVQAVVIDMVEEATEGKHHIVDASNPFTLLVEGATATGSATISSHDSVLRELYKQHAETEEDLYKHMSDKDHLNRFAKPSRTTFLLHISKDEIFRDAVQIGVTGIKMLTIPRETRFQLNNLFFGIYYPIDIRVMEHGGIHVNWDRSEDNPLHAISGNVLETAVWTNSEGTEFLQIEIPVHQFKLESTFHPVSYTSGLKVNIPYLDDFYTARVYTSINNEWVEMVVTHTDQVYDRRKPTAVLSVRNQSVQVTIPQIYITERTVGERIRVDLYTTKGAIDVILDNYSPESYGAIWTDLTNPDGTEFVNAVRKLETVAITSRDVTYGGSDALTFEELRERTIYTSKEDGYTFSDLVSRISDLGYDVSLQYDNITDRHFLATRVLPAPQGQDTSSTIGVTVTPFDFTTENLTHSDNIRVMPKTITVLPRTVFDYTSGNLVVSDNAILNNPTLHNSEEIAEVLNQGKFLYTPFHYVFDITEKDFTSRCYYLESPTIEEREFRGTNASYPLDVSIGRLEYKLTDTGYRLVLLLRSGPTVKLLNDDQINVQLAFTPKQAGRKVYMNGKLHKVNGETTLIENERAYIFDILTDWEIDADDYIYSESFQMFSNDDTSYGMKLKENFDVIISVNDFTAEGTTSSPIDLLLGSPFIPANSVGITHESLVLSIGDRLRPIEGKALTFVSETTYDKYDADVPLINTTPQFKLDADGLLDVTLNGENVEYTIISNVGEQALDENGDPVFLHRAGDAKLDANGDPIVVDAAARTRRTDMILLDARYKYSTEQLMIDYVKELGPTMVSYVTKDIENISKTLAPRTHLTFSPKTNSGIIDVIVTSDDSYKQIDADVAFEVDLYVTGTTFDSLALRKELERSVSNAIAESITTRTISTFDISKAIKDKVDASVMGIHVHPITKQSLDVFTIVREDTSISIASKLIVLTDGSLKIIDDIIVNFHRHTA